MDFRAIFIALLFALTEIKAKTLDSGPQAIKDATSTSNSTQKSQKRYATKEVILYLTPTQIRALQAGKGIESIQPVSEVTEKQPQDDQRLSYQEHEELVRQQFENIKSARVSQGEKPNYENLELVAHFPSYQKSAAANEGDQKKLDFIEIWKQEQDKIEQQAKSENLYSQFAKQQKLEQWGSQNEREAQADRNGWRFYNYQSKPSLPESNQEAKVDDQFKLWNPSLEQNRIQLKALSGLVSEQQTSEKLPTPTEKPLLQMQYSPRHNDQKHAIEIEEILKAHHRQELSKENALAKAEAIANSPPILVHQEIKITKHRPIPVVKHVNVNVPTPVLIPVPEPYEVKVPHPYPVPLEIIRPIPVPIIKTEKIEVEKPVPYEVEKKVPVPVTRQVFVNVDKPYYVHKIVPVEIRKEVPVEIPIRKPEKVTIIKHVWNN